MTARSEVAGIVDHTLLKPEATAEQFAALVAEAQDLGTYSVCVSPSQLPLTGTGDVKVAAVCGFPSGAHHAEVKAAEAARSVADGADEIDMVINLALATTGQFDAVRAEIAAVRAVGHGPGSLGGLDLGVVRPGGEAAHRGDLAVPRAGQRQLAGRDAHRIGAEILRLGHEGGELRGGRLRLEQGVVDDPGDLGTCGHDVAPSFSAKPDSTL